MTGFTIEPDEYDALAAEYVLGVLNWEDRQRAEQLMRSDTVFSDQIEKWQARLKGLNDSFGHLIPPYRVKTRIDRSLFNTRRSTWIFWGRLTAASTSLALVLALLGWQITNNITPDQDLMAELSGENGSAVVSVDRDLAQLNIVSELGDLPSGSVYELWLLQNDTQPVSLGTFSANDSLPLREELTNGANLAVSIEMAGGSPTGLPTGPVVALGELQDV